MREESRITTIKYTSYPSLPPLPAPPLCLLVLPSKKQVKRTKRAMQASTTEPSSNGEEASEKEMLDRFFKFLDDGKAFYKKLTVGQSAFGGHGLIATEDIQVRM